MAELKTRPTRASVSAFLNALEPDRRRDCRTLATLMREVTGARPVMWGPSIVGFGSYRYRYRSGREGEWFPVGFSPRVRDLTIYLLGGFGGLESDLARLGRCRTGSCCLYVRRLGDIDLTILRRLLTRSLRSLARQDTTHELSVTRR